MDEPEVDGERLIRMDDRELSEEIQSQMQARFAELTAGSRARAQPLSRPSCPSTRRPADSAIEGVDYDAAFDTDAICKKD